MYNRVNIKYNSATVKILLKSNLTNNRSFKLVKNNSNEATLYTVKVNPKFYVKIFQKES